MNHADKSCARVAWLLTGLILLSFAFGVAMYLPAEHRAQKFEEMKKKYQAKQHPGIAVFARPSRTRNAATLKEKCRIGGEARRRRATSSSLP